MKVTCNTYLQCFQYKILNILSLDKQLHTFQLIDSPFCSFCKTENETKQHVSHSCTLPCPLWLQLQLCL